MVFELSGWATEPEAATSTLDSGLVVVGYATTFWTVFELVDAYLTMLAELVLADTGLAAGAFDTLDYFLGAAALTGAAIYASAGAAA